MKDILTDAGYTDYEVGFYIDNYSSVVNYSEDVLIKEIISGEVNYEY